MEEERAAAAVEREEEGVVVAVGVSAEHRRLQALCEREYLRARQFGLHTRRTICWRVP